MSPAFFIKLILLSREHEHCSEFLLVKDLLSLKFTLFLQCFVWDYQQLFTTAATVNNLFLRIPTATFLVIKHQLCTVKFVTF